MINPNTLRRFTPSVLPLVIGSALLSGCGRSNESSEICYPAVVTHNVSESVLEVLSKNGHNLDDMLNLNETSSAINLRLVELHQIAKHKYETVLPDDTFQVCVDGDNVTAGHEFSVVDQ